MDSLVASGLKGGELVKEIRKTVEDLSEVLDIAREVNLRRLSKSMCELDPMALMEAAAPHGLCAEDLDRLLILMVNYDSKFKMLIDSGIAWSLYQFAIKMKKPSRSCFGNRAGIL